jgi:phosphate transport system permease protein
MAVKMVAGNQAVFRMPNELFRGIRTLTTNIIMEMGYVEHGSLHFGALIATGVVLFVFILVINMLFTVLNQDKRDKRIQRKKPRAKGAEL